MPRTRFNAPWGIRRDARVKAPRVSAPLYPPLPANAIAMWHAEMDCSSTAWIDQIGGRSMAGINSPVVAADGSFFNGLPVAQPASSGKYWRVTGLPTLAASGTRPWVYCVGRTRVLDGVSRNLVGAGDGTGTKDFGLVQRTSSKRTIWNNTQLAADGAGDTNPHRFASWFDGVNVNIRVDGTNFPTADTSSLGTNWTEVSVGYQNAASQGHGDVSIALYLITASAPSGPEEAALDAYTLAKWGV